jgi:7,8-dihydroneopterin aldolase/epimerase/oxygenase
VTGTATDRIELRGLRVLGRVGILPTERAQDQPLEIDLDLEVELAAAGVSDSLDDTVDYAGVCDAAVAAVRDGHVDLLERLATKVADAALGLDPRIASVDVALRKLRPPVAHHLASAGVRLVRSRP